VSFSIHFLTSKYIEVYYKTRYVRLNMAISFYW